jgi:hypothetical protein
VKKICEAIADVICGLCLTANENKSQEGHEGRNDSEALSCLSGDDREERWDVVREGAHLSARLISSCARKCVHLICFFSVQVHHRQRGIERVSGDSDGVMTVNVCKNVRREERKESEATNTPSLASSLSNHKGEEGEKREIILPNLCSHSWYKDSESLLLQVHSLLRLLTQTPSHIFSPFA